jgi:hypothetical protein
LGVPVSVEKRHTHDQGEPFYYRAQEELNYKWYNYFSEVLKETYNYIISYFGLPEITVVSKAAHDVLRYKGKILYSPETGKPIKQSDWDDFVKLLEKFLNRKLKDTDKKIILDSKALGRILNRMAKYNTVDYITQLPLIDVAYHGKKIDWISDSVKNMQSVFKDALTRQEMAGIQVLQQSAAQRITGVSNEVKSDVQQILIDGVRLRKSKSQISLDIFHKMTGANRDFQKIADTEIQNAFNNSHLLDEVAQAKEGEKVYFERMEVIDGNTCKFCKKMNGVIVLWSDQPLPSDKIQDKIAKFAIWDGKDWDGKKEFVANGVFHPYCRGRWSRYDVAGNALLSKVRWNRAVDTARKEWHTKGIDNPDDTTPGYKERIQELYQGSIQKAYDPNQTRGADGRWTEAGREAREPWDSSTEKAKELKAEDWGTPEEIAEMAKPVRTANNRKEAEHALNDIITNNGQEKTTSRELKSGSGLSAYLRWSSRGKLTSGAQVKGFEEQALYQAVANIDKLFSNAIEPWKFELNPNKSNDGLKDRRILYAPMEYKNQIISVKITVKEYLNKGENAKIYSVDAIDFEIDKKNEDAGMLTAGRMQKAYGLLRPSKASSYNSIAHVFDPVNAYLYNRKETVTERVRKVLGGVSDLEKSLTWSGYKLADRYRFCGLTISIENKKGSVRSGVDKDGHEWHSKMYYDYGYIRGTEGVDGDHVDVYIGGNEAARNVYIVHQNDPVTGKYDEDKVMLGLDSLNEARAAYLKQYDRPGFLGKIAIMSIEEFREKVLSKKYHGKMVKSFRERVEDILGG